MTDIITNRDVQLKQNKQIEHKFDTPNIFPAKLVAVGGSVTPNNQPNNVYFQEYGNENAAVGVAWNVQVKPFAGLAVWISNNPTATHPLEVVDIYSGDSFTDTDIAQYNTSPHGATHEYQSETQFGSDVVRIYQPAIQPLKTLGNQLTFITQPFIYDWFGARVVFHGVSDTVGVSSAGKVRHVLVYLDPASNTIHKLDGVEVLNNGAIPIPFPTIPSNVITSAYLKVDDTQIVETLDARRLFGSSNNEPYTPRQNGDILVGVNGIYKPGLPLIDFLGEIVTDSTGITTI